MNERPLVEVTPDSLSFRLAPNTQPGCPLVVHNSSGVSIAFKVKTTEPKRYLVRPNQGLVGAGGAEQVHVYLIEKECNEIMMQNSGDGDVKTNDKFLVQTVAIGDKDSAKLASLAPVKQVEELTKLWASVSKATVRNKKLSVQISVPISHPGSSPVPAVTGTAPELSPVRPQSRGMNASPFASPIPHPSAPTVVMGGRYGSGNGMGGGVRRAVSAGGGGGEGLDENSRELANKYEDLVNYTANLTEERDALNQSLEEAKKALQREMATRIALESKGQMTQGRQGTRTGGGARASGNVHQTGGGGFGVVTLSLVAIVFFLLGNWLDFANASSASTNAADLCPGGCAARVQPSEDSQGWPGVMEQPTSGAGAGAGASGGSGSDSGGGGGGDGLGLPRAGGANSVSREAEVAASPSPLS